MNSTSLKQNGDCSRPRYERLSYVHNPGKEPLKYMTIGDLVEESARKYGAINAIVSVCDNQRITYREVLERSSQLANGFLSLGLRKGDKIGLWAPNVPEWIIVFFAAARIGLITVTINPKYQAAELQHALKLCDVKALVCSEKCKTLDFYGILLSLIPDLKTSEPGNVSCTSIPTLKNIITITTSKLKGTYSYYDVMNFGTGEIGDECEVAAEDIANLQFSSGTTGRPKVVCLTHFQMVNNAYHMGKRLGIDDDQHVYCLQPPLFHVFGICVCLLSAYHNGTTLVLPSPLYSPSANIKAMAEERCTVVCGTPTMYIDLVSLQSKLNLKLYARRALIGASPWPSKLVDDIKDILKIKDIKCLYGATELTSAAFHSLKEVNKHNDVAENIAYIGEYVEAKVVDRNQNVVPFGTPGELCIRGYLTMTGYWKEPELTAKVLNKDRWFRTGDQFVLYEDGRGKVVGRLKDMIIRGGENISPSEVEEFLHTHPDIVEASVRSFRMRRL
uniref:Medium-chain acyl-CoA ligase ACSF2, mitochondrial n=1 Tax=Photinus pyralis TaxID=7054 RepID=A0A1Y1KLU2_PHOPY